MTKSDIFRRVEILYCSLLLNVRFVISMQPKIFYTLVEYNIAYIQIFLDFFEPSKYDLIIFKIKGSLKLGLHLPTLYKHLTVKGNTEKPFE